MAKDKKSRLAEIYKAEKKRGGGVFSTLGKRGLEKFDPRQIFNQTGFLATVLPSLFKAYTVPTASSLAPVNPLEPSAIKENLKAKESTKPSPLIDKKLDVLINETSDLKTHAKISAKNSLVLPYLARDMNVTRINIQKLVKLMGGTASKGSDAFFKRAGEREALYESQFKREYKSPTKIGMQPTKEPEKKGGGFFSGIGDLVKGVGSAVGGVAAGVGSVVGGVASGAGSIAGGALSGLGSLLGGVIQGLSTVTAAIITLIPAILTLTTSILSSAGSKIADIAKTILTPANLTILAGAVVAALFAYGIYKLLENMREGEKKKDELSKLREKETKGETLTADELARKKELEGQGTTATAGEAGRIATKSSMTLGTAQALLSSNLNDQEIKEQSGVSRKVLQEYVKQGGKTDTFTLSRQMGEEPTGNFVSARPTARQTGDKGTLKGPEGQPPVTVGGQLGYYEKFVSKGVLQQRFIPFSQSATNESEAETARLARQPVIGTTPTVTQKTTPTTPTQYPEQRFPGVTFGMLTRAQQDAFLAEQRKQEGFKPGSLTYDLNNPGAMLYGPIAAKYGAVQNPDRGVGNVKGKFAQFPTLEAGVEAQRELWLSSRYKNLPLDQAINLWTTGKVEGTADPKEAKSIENYKNKIYATVGAAGEVPTNIAAGTIGALEKVKSLLPENIQMPTMANISSGVEKVKGMLAGISLPSLPSLSPASSITGNKLSTATIEVAQARVQIGSAPIIVSPPAVNVQAPQIQAGGGGGMLAASSVVDTEFMKLLVGRTVTI